MWHRRSSDGKKEFDRKRLAFLDRLRRDVRMTAWSRLVGLEIGSLINSTTGDAWPSHDWIEAKLGAAKATVKRAVRELEKFGWYTIARRPTPVGRKNYYLPRLDAGCSRGEGPI